MSDMIHLTSSKMLSPKAAIGGRSMVLGEDSEGMFSEEMAAVMGG